MARIYHRPATVNDYGNPSTEGLGNVLGDNNNSTYKRYTGGDRGSVAIYPIFNEAQLAGKPILAVRAGHVERHGGLYNGWPMTYLRIDGQRYEPSRVYNQTPWNTTWNEKLGPPVYKGKNENWLPSDLLRMTTDIGGANGDFGPSKNKIWCLAAEVFILVVTAEPLPTPVMSTPASSTTTNPTLSANLPQAQPEQSSMMTFEVARNSSFTNDLRTYRTAYRQPNASGSTAYSYAGVPGTPSYADLGPGVWHIRARATDITGAHSQWSTTSQMTITLGNLPVPTLTKPLPGSSSPTPYMIRGAEVPTIGGAQFMPGDRPVGAEWEFSTSPTFASGIVRWRNTQDGVFRPGIVEYDPSPANIEAGLNGYNVAFTDPDQKLPQGTIYARVRAADKWGNVGAWSTTVNFVVDHKPFAKNVIPTGGEDFDPKTNPVSWEFGDPWSDDRQTAYSMVVKDGGTIVHDTGKRYSTATSAILDINDVHLGKVLSYELTLWDADDVGSALPVTSTFKYRRAPIVTISEPSGPIDDGIPLVKWTSVFSESKVQAKCRVIIQNKTSGRIAYDSGTLVTNLNEHKINTQLANMSEFEVRVYVYDTGNLMGMGASSFSTNFILPPTLSVTAFSDDYREGGYNEVMWSGHVDTFFYEFRIYHRMYHEDDPDSVPWKLSGVVRDATHNIFKDYTVSGNGIIEYAVTQVSYRFGSTVESIKSPSLLSRVRISSEDYWLIIPGDEANSVRLHSVVDDSFVEKFEHSSYQIVGGGTRVNKGDAIGIEGQLACRVRSSTSRGATEQVKMLRSIGDVKGHVIMRDPFGNATTVSLGEINVKRIPGVGSNEFADIDIPYVEVR